MQTAETRKKDIVEFFLKKGLLVNHELLESLGDEKKFFEFAGIIDERVPENITVLNGNIEPLISKSEGLGLAELEKLEAVPEKRVKNDHDLANDPLTVKNTGNKTTEKP